MQSTLVDVLLATYNGSRYLEAQLDSILAQTHQDFRVLVSDDGSSDGTLAILDRYRSRFGARLVLVPHPGAGRGVIRNFENLMAASLQDGMAGWVAFCDQDDVWLPHKVERTLAEMKRLEGDDGDTVPCVVHTDLTVVDEHLEVLGASFARHQRINPGDCSALTLLSINQVTGCAMMVNRALLKMALPLPSDTVMHDWWCALIGGSGRRSFVDTPLILYRQHGANQLGAKNRSLVNRLRRLGTDGPGVLRRVRRLGRETYSQAQALQVRLRELGLDDGYVAGYLAWRDAPWWRRLANYRKYYVGPELDRWSRLLFW
ncbi:glycosyltransferase family 2 protein [Paenacidovorax monticola]|uniref:Glycosyltransferase family 2 protein n=1 Tax=Paenacidovorax monticola TaxID=1926868 RepID=A0A7H0HE88_9BURK|nr:glycosyltransferase family 2 protein [Paenacidovorax monticola]